MSTTQSMKFFGDEAFKSAAALLGQEKTLSLLNKTITGTGVAYEQARVNQDNWDGDLKKLDSTIESLSISLGEGLDQSLRSATQGFNELIGDFDRLENTAEAFVSVVGIGMAGALAKSTIATISQTLATIAGTKESLKAAVAAEAQSLAELALAKSGQSSLVSSLALAQTERTRTAIRAQLAESTVVLTAANSAYARSSASVAVATAGAATATNALGVATKFLLGPWGLLLTAVGIAATVFLTAKDESDTLKKSIGEQDAAIAKLTKQYEGNTAAQLTNTLAKTSSIELDFLKKKLEIEEKLNAFGARSTQSQFGDRRVRAHLSRNWGERSAARRRDADHQLRRAAVRCPGRL